MIKDNDISLALQEQIETAIEEKTPLKIQAGGSKSFYGNLLKMETILDVSSHTGIIAYEPTELTLTVRAGSNLLQLEKLLNERGQQLPFEPPIFTENSTIGGAVASGLAGPARPWKGSVRDSILGVRFITGTGKIVKFGGTVMKNVAGYDVSRLMVGSLGTLGVLLDVSLKLIPNPPHEMTLIHEIKQEESLFLCQQWKRKNLPITATCYYEDALYVRFVGYPEVLKDLQQQLVGDILPNGHEFWEKIRNQQHEFFYRQDKPLWRISVAPATPTINRLGDEMMLEWNGAQRWIYSNIPVNIIRSLAQRHQGSAILFRGKVPGANHFPPLNPVLLKLHQRLKRSLDPHKIFNPDKIYKDI